MIYLITEEALTHLKNLLENTHSRTQKDVDESIAVTAVVPLLRFVGLEDWADGLKDANQSKLKEAALKRSSELSGAINSYRQKLNKFNKKIGEMTIYEFEEYLRFIGR